MNRWNSMQENSECIKYYYGVDNLILVHGK